MLSETNKPQNDERKPKTKLEKTLTIWGIVALLVIVFLVIGIIVLSIKSKKKECDTKDCMETAAMYLNYMDENINPCSNFYNYACGNFHKHHSALVDCGVSNHGNEVTKKRNQLTAVLMTPKTEEDPEYYKKIKDFYESCMNTTRLDQIGIEPLIEFLDKLGGWPVIEGSDWKENDFDFTLTLINLYKHGVNLNPFLFISVTKDDKNPINHILELSSSYVPKEQLENLVKIAVHLGANQKTAEAEMELVYNFSCELRDIEWSGWEPEETLTVEEFQKIFPQLDVKKLLNEIGLPKKIYSFDVITSHDIEFFKNLSSLLENTDKRTLSNYLLWRIVEQLLGVLDVYSNYLALPENIFKPRYEYCNTKFLNSFDVGHYTMYIRDVFEKEKKPIAEEVSKNFMNVFSSQIERSKLLDEDIKKKTVEYMSNFGEVVAYSDELLDDAKIDNYYESLSISEDDFFSNIINVNSFNQRKELAKLNERPVDFQWLNDVKELIKLNYERTISASLIVSNLIINRDKPKFAIYGGWGAILGKLASRSVSSFLVVNDVDIDKLMQCDEIKMKFQDPMYIVAAKSAYKAWKSIKEPEIMLPGLSLNTKQLFWLHFANVQCQILQNKSDTTHEDRINFLISNIQEFSKAFECPTGSRMNPSVKCSL